VTHLSAEQLADVDAIAGHEHLAECDRCREQWQQQRAVRDLLRGLPEPGAIPPDVATGLAEALSRLTPADIEPPDRPTQARPVATVVPLGPATAQHWGSRASRARPWLAAAAAVVVLGGGATALVTHARTGGGTASSATSAGSSPERQQAAPGVAKSAATRVQSTGTDYERKDLPAQVRRKLLTAATTDTAGASDHDASAAEGDTRLASPDGLASCVSALGMDVGQVTAVDLAQFEGAPAALLVLRDAAGEQDVWVVGRGCRQGDDQTRYFVRLP
jgi:hypothetical protein